MNNALWILTELSAAGDDYIQDGDLDIYGEDEHGVEGSCTLKIQEIAKIGADRIEELEKQNEELVELSKALLDGADKVSQAPYFILQPFFNIVKKHLTLIDNLKLL